MQNISNFPDLEVLTNGGELSLIFKSVTHSHEGDYSCSVSSFRGTARKEFVLRVRGNQNFFLKSMEYWDFALYSTRHSSNAD